MTELHSYVHRVESARLVRDVERLAPMLERLPDRDKAPSRLGRFVRRLAGTRSGRPERHERQQTTERPAPPKRRPVSHR